MTFLSFQPISDFQKGHFSQLKGAEGTVSGLLQDEHLGEQGLSCDLFSYLVSFDLQVPEVCSPREGIGPLLTLIIEITVLLALLS